MSCSWMLSAAGARTSIAAASSSATCAPPACIHVQALRFRNSPAVRPCGGLERPQVMCMAHPRRVAKVSSQIQREVGDMFVSDPVIQSAICPERLLGDDTLSAVASITNTYVSNDLQVVKVYVSVYSDDYGKRVAMNNLQRLEPYVRRVIGQRVRLRLTPEIRFVYDDSEEEADLVARVIGRDEVERYRSEIEADMLAAGTRRQGRQADEGQARAAGAPAGEHDDAAGEDDGEGEGVDEDEEEEEDEFDEDGLYDDPDERPQEFPDPFSDMFKGNGTGVVQSREELAQQQQQEKEQREKQRGRGRKQGGRQKR